MGAGGFGGILREAAVMQSGATNWSLSRHGRQRCAAGNQGAASPASSACSQSGRSRRDSMPKAARNVSVVTNV